MFVDFSSSPTLSHSFSLILLQIVHLGLQENTFVVYGSFFILVILVGIQYERQEEDSGHSHRVTVTHYIKMRKDWKGMKVEMKVEKLHSHPCGGL